MSQEYEYQQSRRFFAQIQDGLEEEGTLELKTLGATDVKTLFRGLSFRASASVLRGIVYQSRLATRILAPLYTFPAPNPEDLYNGVREINWSDFMGVDHTFAIFATVSDSTITHSQYAGLRVKDAIVDSFRDAYGRRPSVEKNNPDVWINLHLRFNRATLSIDVGGGSLHRRGYRAKNVEAPMQETVGAAIVNMIEWDEKTPLVDPFCGSGTLLSEALMKVSHIPSGFLRQHFGFEQLPDFELSAWKKQRQFLDDAIIPLPKGLISGSDKDSRAASAARHNLSLLPGGGTIEIATTSYDEIESIENSIIVCNPPYGIRMETNTDLQAFYQRFGDYLKQCCKGSQAYVYFGERSLIAHVGLKAKFKKPLMHGGLDGRLVRFDLY